MAPNPTAPENAFCAFALLKSAAPAEAKRKRVLNIMSITTKATDAIKASINDDSRLLIHHLIGMKSTSTYIGRYP
jgi:hypothetical protein